MSNYILNLCVHVAFYIYWLPVFVLVVTSFYFDVLTEVQNPVLQILR